LTPDPSTVTIAVGFAELCLLTTVTKVIASALGCLAEGAFAAAVGSALVFVLGVSTPRGLDDVRRVAITLEYEKATIVVMVIGCALSVVATASDIWQVVRVATEIVAMAAFLVRKRHIVGQAGGQIVRLLDPVDDEIALVAVDDQK
jgi:hypothetical protein